MSKSFIDEKEIGEMDKNMLCTKMICYVNQIINSYDNKATELLQLHFGKDKGGGLFDFVMNSPGGFHEKRADRINRIIYQIDECLRNSQIFDNNIERVEFFLTEILYSLRISILDAEKMFSDLNGEIDKIVSKEEKLV